MPPKRRIATGGFPVRVTPANLPKKKAAPKRTTLRPIPSGSLIRKPGSPRPATWRGGKKKTTSPMRRTRRS